MIYVDEKDSFAYVGRTLPSGVITPKRGVVSNKLYSGRGTFSGGVTTLNASSSPGARGMWLCLTPDIRPSSSVVPYAIEISAYDSDTLYVDSCIIIPNQLIAGTPSGAIYPTGQIAVVAEAKNIATLLISDIGGTFATAIRYCYGDVDSPVFLL